MKPEWHELIQRYIAGTLADADARELEVALKQDDQLADLYLSHVNLDLALAAMSETLEIQQHFKAPVASTPVRQSLWCSRPAWLAAAACFIAMAAGIGWQSSQRVFATVAKGAGAEEFSDGATLRGERHELKAGTVELITARGARVVVEGPAEFYFESAQRLRMKRGRLAAEVPPTAKGFTVVTPSGDAVDLGTRFGVDVPTSGAAEIHVFQGEVIAKASGASTRQSLRRGDAVAMDHGASETRELRSAAFIQPDEMSGLAAGLAAGQRARSEAAIKALRKDPALITLLDFESEEGPHEGVYRVVQGRWPGSRAPEFVNVGDHLKLDVGGERLWPQLTVAAWVRLDRLGAPYQSLLYTDGFQRDPPGALHWMLTKEALMRISFIGNKWGAEGTSEGNRKGWWADSRTPVLAEQGRWVHLAAVYDSSTGSVRHYLNGQLDIDTHMEVSYPARLGNARIGNWDLQDRKLSGRVDELVMLGRAMSDDEMRALFEAGNPYR